MFVAILLSKSNAKSCVVFKKEKKKVVVKRGVCLTFLDTK